MKSLELHIFGPAFSLPSIDPHCLAAVAYVAQTVPRERWVLVASCDEGIGEGKGLPLLKDDTRTIAGYENIVSYICGLEEGHWDLDAHIQSPRDRADIIAFSSHLHSHFLPLLDLSLYVSSSNYITTTRPAYTPLLSFPLSYTIPPARRTLAKARSSHLNLSTLDLDHHDTSDLPTYDQKSIIPERLRKVSQPTVTSLLKQERTTARFRLDALVDAACEPISQLLGSKPYFFAHDEDNDRQLTSLDCLALAYLSLALKADVPHQWLREDLQQRYPNLCAFVERGVSQAFDDPVTVEMAFTPSSDRAGSLPWRAPQSQTATTRAMTFVSSLALDIPFLSPSATIVKQVVEQHDPNTPAHSSSTPMILPAIAATVVAIAAAAGAYVFAPGILGLETVEELSLGDMGEAGALLQGVDFGAGARVAAGGNLGAGVNGSREGREGRVPVGVGLEVIEEA